MKDLGLDAAPFPLAIPGLCPEAVSALQILEREGDFTSLGPGNMTVRHVALANAIVTVNDNVRVVR